MNKILNKKKVSIKVQSIATVLAVAAAVALPQLMHMLGLVSNLGSTIGETFLPMHLPVILVGLLAGPYAGAITGILSPAISFALTGMPASAMLPFMMIELCVYGLSAGLLRNVEMPSVLKVLIVQFAGRAIRAIAILIAFYIIGSKAIAVPVIWKSIIAGIPGIALQLLLIPLIDFRVKNAKGRENE